MTSTLSLPRIGIVIGSTRKNRFGDRPARWLYDLACQRSDMTFEQVDLRDHPMPFFDESVSPLQGAAGNAYAQRWATLVDRLDGFIVVTPEYNCGPSAVLKNAFDHVGREWAGKPIGFVGYGAVGAARAIEQMRLMAIELQMVPVRPVVHIIRQSALEASSRGWEDWAFDDPLLTHSAAKLLDHVGWWAHLLTARRRPPEEFTPG